MNLIQLREALKRYNNKEMPPNIQREIRLQWNNWSLWKYVNYRE